MGRQQLFLGLDLFGKGDGLPIPLPQYGSVAGDAAAPEKAPSFVIHWLPERNELFVHNPF